MTMSLDFLYRKKVRVAVLGATGAVGQMFVHLLKKHPWFQLEAVAASSQSVGKRYGDVVKWGIGEPLPDELAEMIIEPCEPKLACEIVFSALDSSIAGQIESHFADAGYVVISNSSNHRMDPDVPLLVPEVNSSHLELLKKQREVKKGCIVTNPNCVVAGLVIGLKPLADRWGLKAVHVHTLQAISGAGNDPALKEAVHDNVIPYIVGEEKKIEEEPLKILGSYNEKRIIPAHFTISAQCNRVPVSDGHLENIAVKLEKKATLEEIIDAWINFHGEPQDFDLPSAPKQPIHYLIDEAAPQPRLCRDLEEGMAVTIGRLQRCPNFDYKFTLLSHNRIRGAAGAAILNAELMVKTGFIFW